MQLEHAPQSKHLMRLANVHASNALQSGPTVLALQKGLRYMVG